jgi:hypothetical protein
MEKITISTSRSAVLLPASTPLTALALALSYVGGVLRWNIAHRRLEILFPFDGLGGARS